jgi:hypothetical protein
VARAVLLLQRKSTAHVAAAVLQHFD